MIYDHLRKKIFTVTSTWQILLMQITQIKRVYKGFEINNFGEYHDLYVKHDTLLPDDDLAIFGICALKYMNLTLLVFSMHQN